MAYRNKTYIAFASEDIRSYRLMEAWRENRHIDFNFHDAHDLYIALDTSRPQTIKRNLRERLSNTKQAVFLASSNSRLKSRERSSFLFYELEVISELELPLIIANFNSSRDVQRNLIPEKFLQYFTICTSFQPTIIRFAL